MTAVALYRLPYRQQVTLVAQKDDEPQELLSCEFLNGQQGFVVAPFSISHQTPIILIRPDILHTFDTVSDCIDEGNKVFPRLKQPVSTGETTCFNGGNNLRETYASDFARFFQPLKNGQYRKLVLSRCVEEPLVEGMSALQLFQRACQLYPRLFISLVYTAKSGMWLTATPEILLEGEGNEWRTIALAGTMKLEGDELLGEGEHVTWSTKNIQEQRYVATYLMGRLEQLAQNIHEEGPRTVRAANLVHLRSDFTFNLLNKERVGDFLQLLHPTPAVCGLPKDATYRFILDNEHTPRLYYSGFMGPLNISPFSLLGRAKRQSRAHPSPFTSLYVSLRCMQITSDRYRLYAGGGLLKDSIEEMEWQETEAKLETMRQCIAIRKM